MGAQVTDPISYKDNCYAQRNIYVKLSELELTIIC